MQRSLSIQRIHNSTMNSNAISPHRTLPTVLIPFTLLMILGFEALLMWRTTKNPMQNALDFMDYLDFTQTWHTLLNYLVRGCYYRAGGAVTASISCVQTVYFRVFQGVCFDGKQHLLVKHSCVGWRGSTEAVVRVVVIGDRVDLITLEAVMEPRSRKKKHHWKGHVTGLLKGWIS